jgi:hypothetical protein
MSLNKETVMEIIDVRIEGTTPILSHNPAGMAMRKPGKASQIPTPEEEALASCYWTEDKSSIGCPADNIKASMIVAAPAYKIGPKTKAAPYVAGSVSLKPDLIPFNTKEYVIDTRRAVVQRQGILRSRAKLNTWALDFEMVLDEDFLEACTNPEVLKDILAEAGRRVGLLDFRPQRKGWFGKFRVTRFEPRTNGNGKFGSVSGNGKH